METKRFLLTTTYYPPYHLGGDAVHVYHLAQLLAERGHEVHVAALRDPYILLRGGAERSGFVNHPNVHLHSIETTFPRARVVTSFSIGTFGRYVSEARALVAEIRPDVIHHHNIAGFGPEVLSLEAPRTLWTLHDYWSICQRNNLVRFNGTLCDVDFNCESCALLSRKPPQLWRRWMSIADHARGVQTLVTPSQYLGERVAKHLPRPFHVLPNFVPATGRPPASAEERSPAFLFVGMLEKHKGILELLDQYRDYKGETALWVIGEGSLQGQVQRLAARDPRVTTLGRLSAEALGQRFQRARALLFPSVWPENCPTVVLEALAAGTPVVATRLGGTTELLPLAGCLTYPPGQPVPWHEVANLVSPARLPGAITACRAKYDSAFTPDAFVRGYLDLVGRGVSDLRPSSNAS